MRREVQRPLYREAVQDFFPAQAEQRSTYRVAKRSASELPPLDRSRTERRRASFYYIVFGLSLERGLTIYENLEKHSLTGLLSQDEEFEGCLPLQEAGYWMAFKVDEA